MPALIYYTILFFALLFPVSTLSPTERSVSEIVSADLQKLPAGLFESDDLLEIQLTGNIRTLMNDRGNASKRHPLVLSYKESDNSTYTLNIQAKTRGNFRRTMGNCQYPPIMLYFSSGDSLASSVFMGQKKLKLVVPCRSDEYVVREWLAYKIYNLVTPQSFRARLVRITLTESKKSKNAEPFYAMLLEDEDQMAQRNGVLSIKKELMRPEQTESSAFINMAVFQFLIANTDWSVQYMQNIRLLAADSIATPATVPYDFDMSGWVDAPYARPADALHLPSVRSRRYRGYCAKDMKVFEPSLELYKTLRPQIYDLIGNCKYLSPKSQKSRTEFLDGFYAILDDPQKLKNEFLYPCDKNGTGHVIIGGLKSKEEEEEQ